MKFDWDVGVPVGVKRLQSFGWEINEYTSFYVFIQICNQRQLPHVLSF